MILDSQLSLSREQAIASAASTVASTDYYDTGASADVGIGEDLWIQIAIGAVAVTGGTSVQFVLQTDDNTGFSSAKTIPLTAAIPVAQLTARAVVVQARLPVGLERYFRVGYTSVGTTSTGTANAFLAKDLQIAPSIVTSVPSVK